LSVAPNNSLVRDIKAVYSFIEPAAYSSESTREFLYQNPGYIYFTFVKDFIKVINDLNYQMPLNMDAISNYFIYSMGSKNPKYYLGGNQELYKSQYRPMRKGVINMIRLQATNAVAMPIEIRLHILASSKDVIHSWAIPSAGIKIDCVPGYSSHRVAIFLVHGIF
jgi:heme/copper-type cytochrome/quinol oxidase subunit 2